MAKSFMGNGDTLEMGEELRSDNDRFNLRMQEDGNLVLYCEGTPIWATRWKFHNIMHVWALQSTQDRL